MNVNKRIKSRSHQAKNSLRACEKCVDSDPPVYITLRKHTFSNILKILTPKNENFQIKNSDIFHVSAQNIDIDTNTYTYILYIDTNRGLSLENANNIDRDDITHHEPSHLDHHVCVVTCICTVLKVERFHITKTCLYIFDPLQPHYYIVKLGFTGVYIIFLIFAQKHILCVLDRTASSRYIIYVLNRNMKNLSFFI